MTRLLAAVLGLLLVASCDHPPVAADAMPPGVCRIGPDGGPVADRGIGGTGGPQVSRVADRGIGGTGIVGVITGFASICVNGLEVAVNPTTSVDIDGTEANVSALRVGQVVAVHAAGATDALYAQQVSVRHEVAGPVEAVEIGSDALYVAGQRVIVPNNAWGRGSVRLGDWAKISGLRAPDGSIVATRIDPTVAGAVRLVGPLLQVDGRWQIGGIAMAEPPTGRLAHGGFVIATGRLEGRLLLDAAIVPDTLATDPPAFFAGADRLVIEAFARSERGVLNLGDGFQVPFGAGFQRLDTGSDPQVLWLNRHPDGGFTASVPAVPATGGTVTPTGQGNTASPMGGNSTRLPSRQPPFGLAPMGPARGGGSRPRGRHRR